MKKLDKKIKKHKYALHPFGVEPKLPTNQLGYKVSREPFFWIPFIGLILNFFALNIASSIYELDSNDPNTYLAYTPFLISLIISYYVIFCWNINRLRSIKKIAIIFYSLAVFIGFFIQLMLTIIFVHYAISLHSQSLQLLPVISGALSTSLYLSFVYYPHFKWWTRNVTFAD